MCYCKGKFGNSSRNMIIPIVISKNLSVSLLLFFHKQYTQICKLYRRNTYVVVDSFRVIVPI